MRVRPRLAALLRPGSRAILGALGLLVLALALPRFSIPQARWNTIIVFDITQSMNVEDHELDGRPVSRLQYAKHAARSALRALPCGSRVGWAVFAEYRTLLLLAPVEVCSRYGDLLASLDNIDGRMRWGNASEIAKGVFWALRAARQEGTRADVVFLTDGHEAPPLESKEPPRFEDAGQREIHGWLVGVGGDVPRPIPKTDDDLRPLGFFHADEVIQRDLESAASLHEERHEHLSSLHEAYLRLLATQVGLRYARLTTPDSLFSAITSEQLARYESVPTDLAWLPATLALVLLVARFRPDLKASSPAAAD